VFREFKEGEYVHVPSGVIGYSLDEKKKVKTYVKFQEPKLLMYLGEFQDPDFGGDTMCNLFYEGVVYSIHKENVYERRPISE